MNDKQHIELLKKQISETGKEVRCLEFKSNYFVMRDSSLANGQVADNFEQIWQLYSNDTERRIL